MNIALSLLPLLSIAFHVSGYGSGGLNGGINGPLGLGAKGPFTPSQWVELEHQALIYKHIVSNVPVPANLLIALKKSISPYGLFGWSSGSYAPNSCKDALFHENSQNNVVISFVPSSQSFVPLPVLGWKVYLIYWFKESRISNCCSTFRVTCLHCHMPSFSVSFCLSFLLWDMS